MNDDEAQKKGKKFLVDFELKRWDMQEKYEEACREYRGGDAVAEQQPQKKSETNEKPAENVQREEEEEKIGVSIGKGNELMKRARMQEEERAKWEQGVRSGAVQSGEATVDLRKIPIVKQSYDHVLSKDEKSY